MFKHFSYKNITALCTISKTVNGTIDNLDSLECENVRRLMSFRKLVKGERHENKIKLLTDDNYLKGVLKEEVQKNYKYLDGFHIFLRCLRVLVADLPRPPLGKNVRKNWKSLSHKYSRDVTFITIKFDWSLLLARFWKNVFRFQLWEPYIVATTTNITKTEFYVDCFKLLSFQSKDTLVKKCSKCCELIHEGISSSKLNRENLKTELDVLSDIIEELKNVSLENPQDDADATPTQMEGIEVETTSNRRELREVRSFHWNLLFHFEQFSEITWIV